MKTIVLIIIVGCFLIAFNSCSKNLKTDNPITDIDGNNYQTVTIGNQVWMAENLKTTKYRNGDPIPNVTSNTTWTGLTSGAYCWYKNDIANNTTGAIYNFYAVTDNRNIAPIGWHVPTFDDWNVLTAYFGGTKPAYTKLVENGFSIIYAGTRSADGSFSTDLFSYWWTSTGSPTTGEYIEKDYFYKIMNFDPADKKSGYSVRCVKD